MLSSKRVGELGFTTAVCVRALYRAYFRACPLYVYTKISMVANFKNDFSLNRSNIGPTVALYRADIVRREGIAY